MKKKLKFITNNFGAKFFSVILAAIFWVFIMAGETKIGDLPMDIAVNVIGIKSGLSIADDIPEVKIKVKAPSSIFGELSAKDFEAAIDASEITEQGAQSLEVKVKTQNSAVQVINIEPSRYLLKLEKEDSKRITVNLDVIGSPNEDYKVSGGEVKIKDTIVYGAPSKIKEISRVVASLELSGSERGNVEKTVKIKALDQDGEIINHLIFDPKEAEVYVPIIPKVESKTVGIKINLTGEVGKGYWINKLRTDPEVISIKGESKTLKNIDYIETEEVDLAGTEVGLALTAKLNLPEGVYIVDERDIIIQIFVAKIDGAKTVSPTLNFRRSTGNLIVEVINTVTVTLTGSVSSLNSVSTDNVILNIDINSLGVGEHKINLTKSMVTKPGDVEVSNVKPELLTIKLSQPD
jgi:YbbR domain-containing protein